MQHVTAFSRPETVPPVAALVPKRNVWILDSWRDLILYVGTPLLIIPLFTLAQARWSAQEIYLFVAAFGAMGHHLPGMIRAYGDRALFERFRWRFIIAPIFLLAVCVGFYFWDIKTNPVVMIVFLWGVWHGMMQTYGFGRIYDAKTGSFAALTRRLDFAMCGIWFAAGVILSPARMTDTLEGFYGCGLPFISPGGIHALQQTLLFAAVAVSILWLANYVRMWVAGTRQNPVKLAFFVTSVAFWWYCNNGVANILAGIALFEVFHDVQYLSLVWIYNRNRVEKDSSIGGFMRFVFRRSGSLVGLYIGLVFAYGSLAYFNSRLEIDTIKRVLTGVVAASSLLHFYYDGFIWKVREKSTRESLGLTGGSATAATNAFFPSWFLHGLKWAAVFVLPLSALWFWQVHSPVAEIQRRAWVVADVPAGARQHSDYGLALQREGQLEQAEEQYNIALGFNPADAKSHMNLAIVLAGQSKFDAAASHMEAALRLQSNNGEFHLHYANLLQRLGRRDEARPNYEAAARLKPDFPGAHYGYAAFLASEGKNDDAIDELRQVVRLKPDYLDAQLRLADALFAKGDFEEAKTHYIAALRSDPKLVVAYNSLGKLYLSQGQLSQAIVQFSEALRLNPGDKDAEENLRIAKAGDAQVFPQSRK